MDNVFCVKMKSVRIGSMPRLYIHNLLSLIQKKISSGDLIISVVCFSADYRFRICHVYNCIYLNPCNIILDNLKWYL